MTNWFAERTLLNAIQRPIPAGLPTAVVPVSELLLALARVVERASRTVVFAAEVSFSSHVGKPKCRPASLRHPPVAFGTERDQTPFFVATLRNSRWCTWNCSIVRCIWHR